MTKRLAVSAAVFAATWLTACSTQVPVHVNLAPIHATLDPASASSASAAQASSAGS